MRRIYAKEDVCIGCRLCEVHCAVQHSATQDIVKAFRRQSPRPLARVTVEEDGTLSFGMQCRHCDDPMCVYSCISGAMHRESDGTVQVDQERCVGCWTCVLACPYGMVRRMPSAKPAAAKCDMCPGLDIPACVANCPNEALVIEEVSV